jgi:hypothetical protein
MNGKTVVVISILTLVILIGIPESFARTQYLTNLTAVYGDGSCGTCHIKATGGGQRNSYGTLFENQPNFDTDPVTALKAIWKPPSSTVATPGATSTLTATAQVTQALPKSREENETEEELDILEEREGSAVTSVTARGTPAASGFEFAFSLAGLLACVLLARQHNK